MKKSSVLGIVFCTLGVLLLVTGLVASTDVAASREFPWFKIANTAEEPIPVYLVDEVSGTVGAEQSGEWTVGAEQSGEWTVGAEQSGEWTVGVTNSADAPLHVVSVQEGPKRQYFTISKELTAPDGEAYAWSSELDIMLYDNQILVIEQLYGRAYSFWGGGTQPVVHMYLRIGQSVFYLQHMAVELYDMQGWYTAYNPVKLYFTGEDLSGHQYFAANRKKPGLPSHSWSVVMSISGYVETTGPSS